MGQFQDVQEFVGAVKRLSDAVELKDMLSDSLEALGFQQFAFIHHVGNSTVPAGLVRVSNYPESWIEVIRQRHYLSDDPVHAACQRSATSFIWSNLNDIITLTPRQSEIMEAWDGHGLGDGFTVPIHIPGEVSGSCSMGVRAGLALPVHSLPAAQYVASFAFEAARRMARTDAERKDGPTRRLTQRQLDCIVLVAQGKSDWDISRVLGISDQTVHQHVEDAKRRFGVASRTQLVVRALYDSYLNFSDILH